MVDGLECRFCRASLQHRFADLGVSPIANDNLTEQDLLRMEPFYPLTAFVCSECFLVQVPEFEAPASLFDDYAYFSSFSDSWLEHARRYVEMAVERFELGSSSFVVEIASNDGYLLQNFQQRSIPMLGVEPAANVAEAAVAKGIPTRVAFFGSDLAAQVVAEERRADLVIGNNVLAHVPDLNDFVSGLEILLAPAGVVTMEFPHLLRLMEFNQFDTIYHEHFSYLSFGVVQRVFRQHGLEIFDVQEIPTHGGSLRIFACHAGTERPIGERVAELRDRERELGFERLEHYLGFQEQVDAVKRALLRFLIQAKEDGKSVVAYGAPAKGNTLLNYCGVRSDLVEYTVDRSPHKQGRFLPGTHLPICSPDRISETRPDYLLLLPWNLKDEIMQQMSGIRAWGGRFVVPIPRLEILD
jgi:2-polyprenyl-3-methyl-5-hydroxy-6-metoxy-1,4-benzoquinol methylase